MRGSGGAAGSTTCCCDAWNGELKPLYNYMDQLPSLEGEPAPILPRKHVERTSGTYSSIDLGRGCPYQCSFCTIINVQGRKSRFRTPDDLEKIIRANRAQGIDRFFITDDNFARNTDWEILLDRVIELQDEGIHVGFTIQVDTLCHKIPNFIEKATKAGVEAGLHRPREHQPGQSDRRQEATEQDHRIPRHAAEVARARRHHLSPATSSASRPTPRNRSCATSRSSSANCRSTFWSSSSSRPCPAPRTIGPC